jgi:putative endonuclease
MPCFTYILYSVSKNLFYTGSSNDPNKRILYHNQATGKFTDKGIPWTLLWMTQKHDTSDARDLEFKIKNLSKARKIAFIRKYSEGIVDHDLLNSL